MTIDDMSNLEADWKITVYENVDTNMICIEVLNLISCESKIVLAYPIIEANGRKNIVEDAFELADDYRDALIRMFIKV